MAAPHTPPLLDAALAWHDAGVCVLPAAADGSKRPAVPWANYQRQRSDVVDLTGWLGGLTPAHDGIGIVCGAVSGGLEMFELEGAAVADGLHEQLIHLLADVDPALLAKLMTYVETTPGGGLHWLFRVDGTPVLKNTKLAQRSVEKTPANPSGVRVLMETRGEGGWTVAAPSTGRTHPTGRAWQTITGSAGVIATLTADEYATLHRIARTFDEMPQAVPAPYTPPTPRVDGEQTPGDQFNERTPWEEILQPAGWTPVARRGDITYWRRPGKNVGISASTGYGDGDWLYVFSTSTIFESERTYTKFGAWTELNHGGDYSSASKALRQAGLGSPQAVERPITLIYPDSSVTDETTASLVPDERDSYADPTTAIGDVGTGAVAQTVVVSLTDVGNAQLLVAEHGARLKYVPERGHWITWSGTTWTWAPDDSPAVQAMISVIQAIQPADTQQAKHQHRSLNYRPLQSAIATARAHPDMRARLAALDANPYALNTPTGVVDLRTGQIAPGRPEQLHTRLTGAAADLQARAPQWLRFLDDTFAGDAELVTFVQRLAGYSAIGIVTHHVLPFLHGSGGNGKTVFLEVLLRVLGDYATTAPPDFLLSGGREDEAAVARLAGQRMVACSEVNQSARFNEAKVKLLTGGDQITARFLYHEHFTFQPTHQLWLMANHQPQVDAGGEGFWRRLRLIPFSHTVPAARRIDGLAELLAAEEGPGILAWVISGARQVLADGLAEPAAVLAATALYAEEEDALGRFVEDRCRVGGGDIVRIDMRELRGAYEQWCFLEGEKPITPQLFGRELRGRFGVGQAKSNGRKFYTAITLFSPEEPDLDAARPEQLHWTDR